MTLRSDRERAVWAAAFATAVINGFKQNREPENIGDDAAWRAECVILVLRDVLSLADANERVPRWSKGK